MILGSRPERLHICTNTKYTRGHSRIPQGKREVFPRPVRIMYVSSSLFESSPGHPEKLPPRMCSRRLNNNLRHLADPQTR